MFKNCWHLLPFQATVIYWFDPHWDRNRWNQAMCSYIWRRTVCDAIPEKTDDSVLFVVLRCCKLWKSHQCVGNSNSSVSRNMLWTRLMLSISVWCNFFWWWFINCLEFSFKRVFGRILLRTLSRDCNYTIMFTDLTLD